MQLVILDKKASRDRILVEPAKGLTLLEDRPVDVKDLGSQTLFHILDHEPLEHILHF